MERLYFHRLWMNYQFLIVWKIDWMTLFLDHHRDLVQRRNEPPFSELRVELSCQEEDHQRRYISLSTMDSFSSPLSQLLVL